MRTLEFTTTHVSQRGDIIRQTIDSFIDKVVDIDFSESTIYINLDSAPKEVPIEDSSQKTIEYLKSIFKDVIFNIPEEPNFTKAVHWCWSQPKNDFFFHLEDDWVLEKKIELLPLLDYFNDPKVFAVNLRAYPFKGPKPCLLPAIYRKTFCEEFIKTLDFERNPENQLRAYVAKTDLHNLHRPEEIKEIILTDIGRSWLLSNGLSRNHISSRFVNYTRNSK